MPPEADQRVRRGVANPYGTIAPSAAPGRDAEATVERDAATPPNGFLFEDRYEIQGEFGSGSFSRQDGNRVSRSDDVAGL